MSVNPLDLVMGPARMYVNAFGAAEPPDSAVTPNGYTVPPGGSWVDVGGTDGGVGFEVDQTYTELSVDQIIMAIGARLTKSSMQVTAGLAQMTLDNFNVALNNIGVRASGSGYQTMEIPVGSVATQPSYMAVIIDGWAPYTSSGTPALRRIICRKMLSQVKAQLMYDDKTQQKFACTFTMFYVSDSINPVHIVDATA